MRKQTFSLLQDEFTQERNSLQVSSMQQSIHRTHDQNKTIAPLGIFQALCVYSIIKRKEVQIMNYYSNDLMRWTFDDAEDQNIKAIKVAKRYCEKFSEMKENSIGIRLHGEVGTGKTFLASCIGNDLISRGYSVAFIDFLSFIRKMIDYSANVAEINNYLSAQVLIVDDVDLNSLNSVEQSACFRLFNSRMHDYFVTIITTNITSADLLSTSETESLNLKRIKSRIRELCSIGVVLTGDDKRKTIGKHKLEIAQEILKGAE